ncbi:MAG: glycosyltransferase family 2 protein [Chitinispirillaceae bacterium]|nr:glycosyltransferase family 2 protein [Chitinispirillaceae bacterium]
MKPEIDIGIINYNGGELLSGCIGSLKKMTGCTAALYVLDNGSSDDSFVNAQRSYPECTFISSCDNFGYAGGINRLYSSMKSPIVAFCNMDLEFTPEWGQTVVSCLDRHPDVWSVASLVIEKGTNEIYSSAVRFFWDLFPLSSKQPPGSDDPYEVISAYGAVMVFRREIFNRVGLFDDDYFLFFEETEFYLRMHVNGLRTLLCPRARVYHHRSVSTVRYSSIKLYYSERNRLLTAFKYLPFWYIPFLFPLSIARFVLMSRGGIPTADGGGKAMSRSGIIRTLLAAWLSALRYLPREWHKRNVVWRYPTSSVTILQLIARHRLRMNELRLKLPPTVT